MKKLFTLLSLVGAFGANAIVINAPSSLEGYNALDGYRAYQWGISLNLAPNEEITYAKLTFSNVKLTSGNWSGKGYLHTDLLNINKTGVSVKTDWDLPGDYFAGALASSSVVSLGTQYFGYVGQSHSWSYTFNASQLAALNLFAADGIFGLGFDPDCHYKVGDICLTIEKTTRNVPDSGNTVILLGTALIGAMTVRTLRHIHNRAPARVS